MLGGAALPAPRGGVAREHRAAGPRDGGPLLRGLGLAGILGTLAFALHSLAGLGEGSLDPFFEDGVFNALFFIGAALCLARALHTEVDRGAWLTMGVGLTCWASGEVLFAVDPGQVTGGSFPAPSDYLWLAFYPAAFVTLGLLIRARVRTFFRSLWLDGIVGGLAIAALSCQFVLPPIIAETGGSLSSVVGDLIYPLGDLLLLAFVVAVLALTGWRPGRVLGGVALAIALGAVADFASLYSSASGGDGSTAFESLWPASAIVLGLAAWQPPRSSSAFTLQGLRLILFPVGFAVAALGLLLLRRSQPLHDDAYVLALLTLAGAIVRMGFTLSENITLAERSHREALTDALTGLSNRRQLLQDLEASLNLAAQGEPWALLLFDLNGFKRYNDTFGHPVGDALLSRLGARLAEAVGEEGRAYRLGGDEFCLLTRLHARSLEQVRAAAVDALSEQGRGFGITSACGSVELSRECRGSSQAMQTADRRLYADKRSRRSSSDTDQLRDVLLAVISESRADLPEHLREVAELARSVGTRMGLAGEELETVVQGAELHDVGKIAVPDAILSKPAALDAHERAIVERHCEVGERILAAAPSMGRVANLVRASHERFDGYGYPDGQSGNEIPLGARIIAVCDAYQAMTADRPYSEALSSTEAIAELRREAGGQFDPKVVEAFCAAFQGKERLGKHAPGASALQEVLS